MVPCPHRRHGGAGGPAAWQREPLHLDSAEPGTVRALMTPAIPRGRGKGWPGRAAHRATQQQGAVTDTGPLDGKRRLRQRAG